MESPKFQIYRQFNQEENRAFARMKHRIHAMPEALFPSDTVADRLARALAERRVVHIKELLEAFEFYERVRRRLRQETMVDLCAGHGLVGLLFALCEPKVTRVLLVDERTPQSFERILSAFVSIGPWVAEKVSYLEAGLNDAPALPEACGVTLVHACGNLTDTGIAQASKSAAAIAAMPCCYGKAESPTVPGISRELGRRTAIDVSRSYRLHAEGFQVDWSSIPEPITPMNRILLGWNRRPPASGAE